MRTWQNGHMASHPQSGATPAPDWFGAAAQDIAFFPIMMSGYAIFYAVWWPFAWGWVGSAAFVGVLMAAAALVMRGVRQIRHAAQFPNDPTPEIVRERKAMMVLNSVTHPVWMLPSILLIVFGQGRWVIPLMVFAIGVHFLPMARILNRKIDFLLGPVAIIAAVGAGILAWEEQVSWLVVFAVAGIGGAVSTLCYAFYLVREYRRLCERERVPFSVST